MTVAAPKPVTALKSECHPHEQTASHFCGYGSITNNEFGMVRCKKILTSNVDSCVLACVPLQVAVQTDVRCHSIRRQGTYVLAPGIDVNVLE